MFSHFFAADAPFSEAFFEAADFASAARVCSLFNFFSSSAFFSASCYLSISSYSFAISKNVDLSIASLIVGY